MVNSAREPGLQWDVLGEGRKRRLVSLFMRLITSFTISALLSSMLGVVGSCRGGERVGFQGSPSLISGAAGRVWTGILPDVVRGQGVSHKLLGHEEGFFCSDLSRRPSVELVSDLDFWIW